MRGGLARGSAFMILVLASLIVLVTCKAARGQGANIEQAEYDALVALYNATNGSNWTNKTGWLIGDDPGTWFGVSMKNNRVNFINLPENNLDGTLPSQLGDLQMLEWISLRGNNLTGSIPPAIGSLPLIEGIDLSDNHLTGSIPLSLENLTSLKFLYLNDNELSGVLPPVGRLLNLQEFNARSNRLTGGLPPGLGDLDRLERLDLGQNMLTGSIPSEIGNLTNLLVLSLTENHISGEIPDVVGNLKRLEHLVLFSNELTGAVPETICGLESLVVLHLGTNYFEDVPDLSCLAPLDFLDLAFNRLTFEDLEPNMGLATEFFYAPQSGFIAEAQWDTISVGEDITFSVPVGGEHNLYQWHFYDVPILFATSDTFTIEDADMSHTGYYKLEVTNPVVPSLVLRSDWMFVWVNYPPDTPQIFHPADSSSMFLQGHAGSLFRTVWTPVADPNAEPVTFTWQLALSPDFADPLLQEETSETFVELDFGTLYTALTTHGLTEGESVYVYHRILATDGRLTSISDPCVVWVTIGSVNVAVEEIGDLPPSLRLLGSYPNPVSRSMRLTFDLPANADVHVQFFDVTGRVVWQSPAFHAQAGFERSLGLDLPDLPPGIYLYRLSARSGREEWMAGDAVILF